MKKILSILWIVLLLSSSSFAQEKNPDTFVYKIFTAIKNNDSSSFVKLFANYKQFKSLLVESIERDGKDSVHKTMTIQDALKFSEKDYEEAVVKSIEEEFRKFQNRIHSKGIDASALNFVSDQYEEQEAKLFNDQKIFSGTLFVKDDREDYKIPFEVTWLEKQKGWFGLRLRSILKKNEKEILPVGDTIVVETIEKTEEIVPPSPPPPPPKKKTQIKSPGKKKKIRS